MFKDIDINSKISVIIPVYNEGPHIAKNIELVHRLFQGLGGPFEIIIIDDHSADNTLSEAKSAQANFSNIILLRNEINSGKGASIRKGFSGASGDYIIFLDGDCDLDPRQIGRFFAILNKDNADIVIGCKRHPDSKISYPLYRRILSTGYFFLVKLLFGLPIRDTQTGLKLFKREVLEKVMPKLLIKAYAFDLEVLVLAFSFGYQISEAPIEMHYKGKLGRIGLLSIISIALDTLGIFYRLKVLKYYDYPRPEINSFPKVSILIPLKQKTKYIDQCLKLCDQLNYPDYEIILLPDQELSVASAKVKVVPTGDVSPPEKRDIGAKHAQGEILALIDDDAYPAEDWLRQGVKHFTDQDVTAVGGPASDAADDSDEQRASGAIFSSRMVSGANSYRYVPDILREVDDYPSCNFLVRKEDFNKVNGFSVKYWPGEDTFLCLKLTKDLNKKIVYDPEAVVYHRRRPVFAGHLRQVSGYALHRGYFVKKFPRTSCKFSYFLPSIFSIYIMANLIFFKQLNYLFSFLYIWVVIIYLCMLAFTAIRVLNRKIAGLVFIGIPLTHLTYGFYFIKGLLAKSMPEEKR